MGWILRTKDDVNNPTLAGGVYGKFITAGRPVYWKYNGTQTCGIIFIADGGKYGLDRLDSFEYKGDILTETTQWIFHRGTLTKQIDPYDFTINTTTDVCTAAGHPFANGDLVRAGVSDGSLTAEIDMGLKYMISDVSGDDFKLKDATGTSYIDFVDAGTGTQKIWIADAGRDDPDQGWPTFCPEVETTFNNISYVEFKLPTNRSSATEQPDWQDFRAIGVGRRLMEYDSSGNEVGLVDTDEVTLSNLALQVADNFFTAMELQSSRVHWASWYEFYVACAGQIWQRFSETGDVVGFIARYYQDQVFQNLIVTRLDSTINIGGTKTNSPAPGVTGENFSVRWNGSVKPRYTEVYTITAIHNDSMKIWIDGQLVFNNATSGTHTFTAAFVADQLYAFQIELIQTGPVTSGSNDWEARLKWNSTSQTLEVIPESRIYAPDGPVQRYECHTAFPFPIEASEVHERLMERAPGWDYTDRDGLIEFLGPDRPIAFAFAFDKIDDDSLANFVKGTFSKTRRPLGDRKNFILFRYRNAMFTGYPFAFVQADRPELRKLTNGQPTNDPATDLGVSTRSLAERMGEHVMVFQSDPTHTAKISGGRASSKIRKNELVSVSYYDNDGNYVTDATYMVTFHAWGAPNDRNDFTLLPVPRPFYTDEPYILDPPPLLGGLHNEFEGSLFDTNHWGITGSTVTQTGGLLEISGTTDAWIRTTEIPVAGNLDLSWDVTMTWQFVGVPAASPNYSQQLILATDDTFANYISVEILNGNIVISDDNLGVLFTKAYNRFLHAHFRLRFVGTSCHIDVSRDKQSWTHLFNWVTTVSRGSLRIYMRHQVFSGSSVTHKFDNFDSNYIIPIPTTTEAATSITSTTADLHGTCNPNGSGAIGWFRIDTVDPGLGNYTSGTRVPASGATFLGGGTSGVPFTENTSTGLTLSPNTTYYYWAIGLNNFGFGFGNVMSFTTLP